MQATRESFGWIWTFPLFHQRENKQVAKEKQLLCFHSLFESWQTPYRYKTADDFSWIELGKIPEDTQSQ